MNKPYICNYHVPIAALWESNGEKPSGFVDDLEQLTRQSRQDADALHERVLKLTDDLRVSTINLEIARRKVEALTVLNDELSTLRRDGTVASSRNAGSSPDQREKLKSLGALKRRRTTILLSGATILVLLSAALLALYHYNEPLVRTVTARVTASFLAIVSMRSH
jgi:hypothetical protein